MSTTPDFWLEQLGSKEENKIQDEQRAHTVQAELCSQSTDAEQGPVYS